MASEPGRGPGGLYGLGATEAAEEALRRFAALVEEAEKPTQLLEAVDYLAATVAARPFSAPLANTAREILSRMAEGSYRGIDELKQSVSELVRDVLRRVIEETEEAAEIAARRLWSGRLRGGLRLGA